MMDPPRYRSNASSARYVRPGDLPDAIGVTAAPDPRRLIGMAFGAGLMPFAALLRCMRYMAVFGLTDFLDVSKVMRILGVCVTCCHPVFCHLWR